MPVLNLSITSEGLQAATDATASGVKLSLTEIHLGSDNQSSPTTIANTVKTLTIASVQEVGNALSLSVLDESSDDWSAKEIGVITSEGVLFAYGSHSTPIATKEANETVSFVLFLQLHSISPTTITTGDVTPLFPRATPLVAGIAPIATADEVLGGIVDNKITTPAGVKASVLAHAPSAPTASSSQAGLVELATEDEARDGRDSLRAVTPAGLRSAVPALVNPIPLASESGRGIVELATTEETKTGTDTIRAVTPAGSAAARSWFPPISYNQTLSGTNENSTQFDSTVIAPSSQPRIQIKFSLTPRDNTHESGYKFVFTDASNQVVNVEAMRLEIYDYTVTNLAYWRLKIPKDTQSVDFQMEIQHRPTYTHIIFSKGLFITPSVHHHFLHSTSFFALHGGGSGVRGYSIDYFNYQFYYKHFYTEPTLLLRSTVKALSIAPYSGEAGHRFDFSAEQFIGRV